MPSVYRPDAEFLAVLRDGTAGELDAMALEELRSQPLVGELRPGQRQVVELVAPQGLPAWHERRQLGLHHAGASVEFWGGTLEIASTLGRGTVVAVLLPLSPDNWDAALVDDDPIYIWRPGTIR